MGKISETNHINSDTFMDKSRNMYIVYQFIRSILKFIFCSLPCIYYYQIQYRFQFGNICKKELVLVDIGG
jgi:hypothetical protein